jgi:hypothetical protein
MGSLECRSASVIALQQQQLLYGCVVPLLSRRREWRHVSNANCMFVACAVQPYEVVMVLWAAAKLGYGDPGERCSSLKGAADRNIGACYCT